MKNALIVLSVSCLFIFSGCGSNNRFFHNQFLKTRGSKIVDQKGEEVYLYGVNIGGWLLVEPSLLKMENKGIRSEKDIFDKLESRFGKNPARELYQIYMDNFITSQDLNSIADAGMNCIRVPFWYASLFDQKYSRKEFYYLDRIIGWAKSSHLYVIIDMHGAPGGQSADAEKTGEDGANQMWTDPAKLNETIRMWGKIAERYRNERIVAGYDLLNEPTGAPSLPGSIKDLAHFYDVLYRTIREKDTNHLIFMEDAGLGVFRLPLPASMGWENVVYSFHFYPSTNDLKGFLQTGTDTLSLIKRAQFYMNVPFHVGEFNSVQEQAGGVEALKKLFNQFRAYGWSWNLWTYKKIEDRPDYNWGLTGYVDTQTDIDLNSATIDIFRDLFKQYNTSYLKKNPALETAVRDFYASVNAPGALNRLKDDLVLYPEEGAMVRNTNTGIRMAWTPAGEPVFSDWSGGDTASWLVGITSPGVYGLKMDYTGMTGSNTVFNSEVWVDGHYFTNFVLTPALNAVSNVIPAVSYLLLSNGTHVLELKADKENTVRIELRSVELFPAGGENEFASPDYRKIRLSSMYFFAINQTNGDACVEWQNPRANFGHWMNGEGATWAFESDESVYYRVSLDVSSTNSGSRFEVNANAEERTNSADIPNTGDLNKYKNVEAGKLKFRQGLNFLFIRAVTKKTGIAGNLAGIRLQKTGK